MTFTGPTGDTGLQGTLPLSFEGSGSIAKGQGVCICGDMQVKQPGTGLATHNYASGCVGVADAATTDGQWAAVYGPGAIVRVIISGTSKCEHGAKLYCVSEGKWSTLAYACASGVSAIALEDQATANGTARVLLR